MAGPYTSTFTLSNGQTLRVYQDANQAASSYVNCETNGEVSTTSPEDFEVRSPCYISDLITAQTAGIVEIYGGGVPSGITILMDNRFTSSNHDRKSCLPSGNVYQMVPGKRYRLRQITAGAA